MTDNVVGDGIGQLGLPDYLLAIALDPYRVLTVDGLQGLHECIAITATVQQW